MNMQKIENIAWLAPSTGGQGLVGRKIRGMETALEDWKEGIDSRIVTRDGDNARLEWVRDSGTACFLDRGDQRPAFHGPFTSQTIGHHENFRDSRRRDLPPVPKRLGAKLLKRPVVEGHERGWGGNAGARFHQLIKAGDVRHHTLFELLPIAGSLLFSGNSAHIIIGLPPC